MYEGHTKYVAAYNCVQRPGGFTYKLIFAGIGVVLSQYVKMSSLPRVIGFLKAFQAFHIRWIFYADYLADKIDAPFLYPRSDAVFFDDLAYAKVSFSAIDIS